MAEGTYYTSLPSTFRFDSQNGLWAIISRHFARETTGEVRVMTQAPRPGAILLQTEIPTLLKGIKERRGATILNGISADALRVIYNNHADSERREEELPHLALLSGVKPSHLTAPTEKDFDNFVHMEITAENYGKLVQGYGRDIPEEILYNRHQFDKGKGEFGTNHYDFADSTLRLLRKAGVMGGLIDFAATATRAVKDAADAGKAKAAWMDWAMDMDGATVQSRSTFTPLFAAILGADRYGFAPEVSRAAGLANAVFTGLYGEAFPQGLRQLTHSLDAARQQALFDHLGGQVFGKDGGAAQIPTALAEQKVVLRDSEMAVDELVRQAKGNMAYRHALRHLTPVIAAGADVAADNADGSLALWDAQHPQGMTTPYLRDRATMLLLQARYLKNGQQALTAAQVSDVARGEWSYVDLGSHPFVSDAESWKISAGQGKPRQDLNRVVFGKPNERNALGGGTDKDHLYGGNQDDVLDGKGGRDYLEGGLGQDTYVFASSYSDKSTVFDADGKGLLQVDGTAYHKLVFKPRGGYYTDDKRFSFRNLMNDRWEISVLKDGSYKAFADIQHWKNGDLGLFVEEDGGQPQPAAPVPPEAGDTPVVSGVAGKENVFAFNASGSFRVVGTDTRDSIQAGPLQAGKSGYALIAQTGAGNDSVFGSFARDWIDGGADADLLNGSPFVLPGKDWRSEEDKKKDGDVITGGGGGDFINGMAGDADEAGISRFGRGCRGEVQTFLRARRHDHHHPRDRERDGPLPYLGSHLYRQRLGVVRQPEYRQPARRPRQLDDQHFA